MTHSHNITKEQALAILLDGKPLQLGPRSRTPLLEAVIGIGKDHSAYVLIHEDDLAALQAHVAAEKLARQSSPEDVTSAKTQTVRSSYADRQVVSLEDYRANKSQVPDPASNVQEFIDYAVPKLEAFMERARKGEIRALVVAAELRTGALELSYPTGTWEPNLIAGLLRIQNVLTEQG